MASLLRSRLNLSARRVPSLHASANSVRCVQRRLASDQASGSTNIPVYLPALGAVSLALVVYLVSSIFVGVVCIKVMTINSVLAPYT